MGPNESWQSDVERELKRINDISINNAINQLALEGQSNYQLPARTTQSDQETEKQAWIRLTEKSVVNGRTVYSWREQVSTQTGTGIYWVDNGNSGSYQSVPAVGLNNDNVAIGDGKRYPARFNSSTSEWVFFSNQATGQLMFRWDDSYWVYCGFSSEPVLNNATSANVTKDAASLSAAIIALNARHYPPTKQRWIYYSPGLGMAWNAIGLQLTNGQQNFGISSSLTSTEISLLQAHVTKVEFFSWIEAFPDGTPADSSFPQGDSPSYAGVMTGVATGQYVPDAGIRLDGPGYGGGYYPLGSNHMGWDEGDPALPYVGNYYDANEDRYTSSQTTIYKRVTFKKYLANGTYNNQTNSITLTRVLPSNTTSDANNPIYFNYGPIKDAEGHYTFPACITGSGFTGGTGSVSVGWGNLTMVTSNITNANGPLTPP